MTDPMMPLADFGRLVIQNDPVEVVLKCAAISRRMDKEGKTLHKEPLSATLEELARTRYALVTHHGLAAVVRAAIRDHDKAESTSVSAKHLMALAHIWNNVEDPFLGSGIMTWVRVAYEQFPYQERLEDLVPRYLAILTETKPAHPFLDIPGTFQSGTGLSIEEFMKIGVVFYSGALQHTAFGRHYLEETKSDRLKALLTPERIDNFLEIAAADFPTFRHLCLEEEEEAPEAGRWVFNPLISRPVVILPDGRFCVPIPRLLIQRITKGIYYDLLDTFATPTDNPFLEWFGHAFEEYGGIILRAALAPSKVHPEPPYGSPVKHGPDWTILEDRVGLAMEFRSSRLPKKVRTTTDRDKVLKRVDAALTQTAGHLPAKIQDILDGTAGLPPSDVGEIVSAIVTLEEWHPQALTSELIRAELAKEGGDAGRFQLMSIGDLELLLTWAQNEPPESVLRDKLADPTLDDLSVSQYLRKRADDQDLSFPERLLKDREDAFFAQLRGPYDQYGDLTLQ